MSTCQVCSTTERPVYATAGEVCERCYATMATHLKQVEACLLALSAVPEKVVSPFDGSPQAPGFRSTSPARDDVITATDIRTGVSREFPNPGAMAALVSWCQLVSEEREVKPPGDCTPGTLCEYLRRHHEWVTRQPWVSEYADELRGIRDQVRALVGYAPERPVGRCISIVDGGDDCSGPVFPTPDRDGVRCSWCHRVYTGHDLARLHVSQREAQ